MYQIYHDSLPDQFTALFETRNTNTNYNLRRNNHFSHVRYNSNIGRNSVRYRGPIVWNLIPEAIKDASSHQRFKQKLRQAADTGPNSIKKRGLSDNIKTIRLFVFLVFNFRIFLNYFI